MDRGADVRLARFPSAATAAGTRAGPAYDFVGFDRRTPLLWLAVACAVLAVALLRGRGVLALAGVAASLVLVTQFVVPALLDGRPPALVALVGALAVMFITAVLIARIRAASLGEAHAHAH